MTLNEMKPGQSAIITGYGTDGTSGDNAESVRKYRAKLLALGLTRGAKVRYVNQAPLGDPIKLEVRGFHLSLRKDEAAVIKVQPVEG